MTGCRQWITWITVALTLAGCSETAYFSACHTVTGALAENDVIAFEFEVEDTSAVYDVIVDVSHDRDYKFQNFYTQMSTLFPNGDTIRDVVSLDLMNRKGESNGQCSSTVCTVNFLVQQHIYFKEAGPYSISMKQYSRLDSLEGIREICLRIREVRE